MTCEDGKDWEMLFWLYHMLTPPMTQEGSAPSPMPIGARIHLQSSTCILYQTHETKFPFLSPTPVLQLLVLSFRNLITNSSSTHQQLITNSSPHATKTRLPEPSLSLTTTTSHLSPHTNTTATTKNVRKHTRINPHIRRPTLQPAPQTPRPLPHQQTSRRPNPPLRTPGPPNPGLVLLKTPLAHKRRRRTPRNRRQRAGFLGRRRQWRVPRLQSQQAERVRAAARHGRGDGEGEGGRRV